MSDVGDRRDRLRQGIPLHAGWNGRGAGSVRGWHTRQPIRNLGNAENLVSEPSFSGRTAARVWYDERN